MIGVTMGDGNGIGPELILKAYKDKELSGEFVVIGDYSVLDYCNEVCRFGVKINSIKDTNGFQADTLNVLNLNLLTRYDIEPGTLSKNGAAAYKAYVIKATELANSGLLSAIVTLPVNKEAIRLSDPNFTGHTELIAELCRENNITMMLVSEKLTVTHVNT